MRAEHFQKINNVQRMMRSCQRDTDANLGTFHWPNLGRVEQNNESDSYSSGKLRHLLFPKERLHVQPAHPAGILRPARAHGAGAPSLSETPLPLHTSDSSLELLAGHDGHQTRDQVKREKGPLSKMMPEKATRFHPGSQGRLSPPSARQSRSKFPKIFE